MSLFNVLGNESGKNEIEAAVSVPDNSEFTDAHALKYFKNKLIDFKAEKSYHFWSDGRFSLHELVAHLVNKIGACSVHLCTWAISEQAAMVLADLRKSGKITHITGIFDHTIESYKNEAFSLCQGFFDVLHLTQIHAKVVVLQNEQWGISITSSANMNVNPKKERTTIFTSPEVAKMDSAWLMEIINRESNAYKK